MLMVERGVHPLSTPAPRPHLLARARHGVERDGWLAALKEAATRPLRPGLAPVAAFRLRRRARGVVGIDPLLDLAFDFEAFGITIRPRQVRDEFRQLLIEVSRVRPRNMVEIGTASGGSLFAFAGVCAPDARIISVDLPHGHFGGGYPPWRIPIYRSFARARQRLELVRGDSHDPTTRAQVRILLEQEPIDFLFIDGDHTYDGVRADFEAYTPLVRRGGLIAFHDIAPPRDPHAALRDGNEYLVGEVPRFWEELKSRRGSAREFIDPTGRGCFGIGLIRA